eukprot:1741998-Prymnesium_polylepis.1
MRCRWTGGPGGGSDRFGLGERGHRARGTVGLGVGSASVHAATFAFAPAGPRPDRESVQVSAQRRASRTNSRTPDLMADRGVAILSARFTRRSSGYRLLRPHH